MLKVKVNGVERSFDGDPKMPLLWYLRDILGLTGTKFGCGMALCGACTVLQNGKAVRSCSKQMSNVEGLDITTIEAISSNGPHAVQKAWAEVNVPRCGYCHPGLWARLRFIPAFLSAFTRTGWFTSWRTGRRWATACAPACRGFLPTNSTPTGAASPSFREMGMPHTVRKIPTGRIRCVSSLTFFARQARPHD